MVVQIGESTEVHHIWVELMVSLFWPGRPEAERKPRRRTLRIVSNDWETWRRLKMERLRSQGSSAWNIKSTTLGLQYCGRRFPRCHYHRIDLGLFFQLCRRSAELGLRFRWKDRHSGCRWRIGLYDVYMMLYVSIWDPETTEPVRVVPQFPGTHDAAGVRKAALFFKKSSTDHLKCWGTTTTVNTLFLDFSGLCLLLVASCY